MLNCIDNSGAAVVECVAVVVKDFKPGDIPVLRRLATVATITGNATVRGVVEWIYVPLNCMVHGIITIRWIVEEEDKCLCRKMPVLEESSESTTGPISQQPQIKYYSNFLETCISFL